MSKSEDTVGRVEASYTRWYAEELPLPEEPEAAPLEGGLKLIEAYTGLSSEEVRKHVKAIVRVIPGSPAQTRQCIAADSRLTSARQGLRYLQVPVPRALALPDPVPYWLSRVPKHSPSPKVRRETSRCRLLLRTRPPPICPQRCSQREPSGYRH